MKPTLFLGGTCNNSTWREKLIPLLKINCFNPVVDNWTIECQEEELRQREICDYVLYTITPLMTGFYSIAEVVDDSNKRPEKTILCIIGEDNGVKFTAHQAKSILAIAAMVERNGGFTTNNLQAVADYLNNK